MIPVRRTVAESCHDRRNAGETPALLELGSGQLDEAF